MLEMFYVWNVEKYKKKKQDKEILNNIDALTTVVNIVIRNYLLTRAHKENTAIKLAKDMIIVELLNILGDRQKRKQPP